MLFKHLFKEKNQRNRRKHYLLCVVICFCVALPPKLYTLNLQVYNTLKFCGSRIQAHLACPRVTVSHQAAIKATVIPSLDFGRIHFQVYSPCGPLHRALHNFRSFLPREKKIGGEDGGQWGGGRERDHSLCTIMSEVLSYHFQFILIQLTLFIRSELRGTAHAQREGIKERDLPRA